jgi:hypothetical protein
MEKAAIILRSSRDPQGDTEVGPDHPMALALAELRRQQNIERIALDGLDPAATTRLFETVAGPAAAEV